MIYLVSALVPMVWCMKSLLNDTDIVASMARQYYRKFSINICSRVSFYGDRVGVVSGGGVIWPL